jgi:nitrate reductase gamma subunit
MFQKLFAILIVFIYNFLFIVPPAYAYVGPGMGGGIIASVLGIVIGIVTAIIGILWFPIKRFIKKRKEND